MKTLKKQFLYILIIMFTTSFAVSCTSQQKDENNEHGDMMEGEDHMNDDSQDHRDGDEEMMQDTTSMEMDEGNEDMMQ